MLLTGSDEVDDDVPRGVLDHRARRHRQHQVCAVGSVAFVTRTGLAVAGRLVRVVVVVEQGGRLRVDAQDHRAALAPVPTVGTAERLELLPLDGGDPVAAVTRRDVEDDPVDEARRWHTVPPARALLVNRS